MAYNPNNANGSATSANSAPVVIASDQSPIKVGTVGTTDIFGILRTSSSHNDIDIQFFRDDPNNTLTVTTASGGTVTQTAGYAQFATSTATTGSIKGVSVDKTHYHSGGELYCLFTAAWLDGGVATSFQRIGLYDTSNGFFIGYENTTFGISVRAGGTDTQTAKASWNVDTLVGGATSKFTRGGTPEAINLALLNVFRVRFGWLGSANVNFEVMSPDGEWVLFHQIRQPNLAATPSIQNPDLPMTAEITKTAGATNIRINSNCWGAGIQYEIHDWSENSTLSATTGQAVEYNTSSLGSASIYVATTAASGTIIFEANIDGKTWFTHPGVIDPNLLTSDTIVEGAIAATAGNYYLIPLTGFKSFRVKTFSTLANAVVLYFVGDTHDLFLPDLAPSPHNIGYTQIHRDRAYTTAQTSTSFYAPTATTKKFVITDFTITTGGTTAGVVNLYDATSGTAFAQNTTPAIFTGEFAPSTTSRPGITKDFKVPYISTTANNNIMITTSAAMTIYVQVNGYEI
jgi:hypothetical protein